MKDAVEKDEDDSSSSSDEDEQEKVGETDEVRKFGDVPASLLWMQFAEIDSPRFSMSAQISLSVTFQR